MREGTPTLSPSRQSSSALLALTGALRRSRELAAERRDATLSTRTQVDLMYLERVLRSTASRPVALRPVLSRCVAAARAQPHVLDELLDVLGSMAQADISLAPRAFAAMAESLVLAAGPQARERGVASPASRAALPLHRLASPEGLEALVHELHRRLARADGKPLSADEMVCLAEEYEAAAMACVGVCVGTAVVHPTGGVPPPPLGAWATARCPARVDLAGGWTDTPPICYEAGGRVVNLAVRVDGRQPIGARARRIRPPHVLIVPRGTPPIVLTRLDELAGRHDPHAVGALIQAVLVTVGALDAGGEALEEQLRAAGGGLEVEYWSELPHGSGLGTSSILAAAAVSAVCAVLGQSLDAPSLAHLVTKVEQCLTTGGGWQDQLGGCIGGAKLCACAPALPLAVSCERLPCDLTKLDAHLALIYTGQTRLAKSLLQDVLRRWLLGRPASAANVEALVGTADAVAAALTAGDVPAIGGALRSYWGQKMRMCDAEPACVTRLLQAMYERGLIHGGALAGAGGGGFLLVVTREPHARAVLAPLVAAEGMELHEISVDDDGLTLSLDDEPSAETALGATPVVASAAPAPLPGTKAWGKQKVQAPPVAPAEAQAVEGPGLGSPAWSAMAAAAEKVHAHQPDDGDDCAARGDPTPPAAPPPPQPASSTSGGRGSADGGASEGTEEEEDEEEEETDDDEEALNELMDEHEQAIELMTHRCTDGRLEWPARTGCANGLRERPRSPSPFPRSRSRVLPLSPHRPALPRLGLRPAVDRPTPPRSRRPIWQVHGRDPRASARRARAAQGVVPRAPLVRFVRGVGVEAADR